MDFISYTNADFADYKLDRKSTSGSCHFLDSSLVSWSCKKQNSTALSATEAEYITTSSYCAQVLWMIKTLRDFGLELTKVLIFVIIQVL